MLDLVSAQYTTWQDELGPALVAENIHFLTRKQWTARQRRWLHGYFENEVLPVLSLLELDPAHPFPRILNKTLNIAVVRQGRDAFGHEGHMALVRAPRSLPRIIRIPNEVCGASDHYVFLAELLQAFVDMMFPGFKVAGSHQFHLTRNSELIVEEEEVENLARALAEDLHGRGYARPVRLEIGADCSHLDATSFGSHEAELTTHEDFRLASRGTPVHENIAILTQDHHVSAVACQIVHNIE